MEPEKSVTTTIPRLVRRKEFEDALAHYKISDAGLKMLRETPFTVMVAATSTGRNTIIAELVKTGNYHFIISDTTRPPRYNNGVLEQNGREYFFRTEEEMLADIKAGGFVEAELIHSQQVSGMSIREIEKACKQGKIAISDVEILGGITVANLKPDATVIYLVPPSFEEWLKRIHGRTPVTPGELKNRLESAVKGFKLALANEHFIFVVNDNLADAVRKVDEIARLHHRNPSEEAAARAATQQLLVRTEEYLVVA
jgi:guanylate kinase